MKSRNVVLANEAKAQLRRSYSHIRKDSIQNAQKVKTKLLASIKELSNNPHKHPPDKYKTNNDGSFRAYELYKYRITYHISDLQITVIRIRHAKMNPLEY